MSDIEWTNETWNPIVGCRRVSAGCEHCYAERMAARLASNPKTPQYDGIAEFTEAGPRWTGEVRTLPEKLYEPLSWRKPRRVFVNSMSDLFHPAVSFGFVAAVFGIMALTPRHTYQILTKRPDRMFLFFEWLQRNVAVGVEPSAEALAGIAIEQMEDRPSIEDCPDEDPGWPLPNVWLGVSAEDQATADERIPPLIESPADVHFVSAEPLLGLIHFDRIRNDSWGRYNTLRDGLDWIVLGGESGPGARRCDLSAIRQIVADARGNGVAVFVKQLGARPVERMSSDDHTPDTLSEVEDVWPVGGESTHVASNFWTPDLEDSKGGDPSEWPEALRVRQFPGGSDESP